jgi:hypothetical protein
MRCDLILDKDGNIAVRYRESLPKGISGPSGRDYLFQVKGMVSLCYIHPSDWPWFSRFRGGGCCGHGGPVMFWEAGARDVEIWSA